MATKQDQRPADEEFVNHVTLCGRVSHVGEVRELPSGDRVHAWRLVVPRTGGAGAGSGAKQRSQPDVIDVSCWSAATRRATSRLVEGDLVQVEGALRRRFFRGAGGVASRYEVEALLVRRA
jgi:single-strand DNA-binding protein